MCPGGFSGVCRRNMRPRAAKWHPYDGCGDMLTAYTCQCSCSRPPEEVPLACSLLENRIQRDFDRLDGDDDTRFLLLLFDRVHVAIETLFAGVALRECVGMGFCACSSYFHHVALTSIHRLPSCGSITSSATFGLARMFRPFCLSSVVLMST